jgi:hypothetical protein
MIREVAEKQSKIAVLCARYRVRRLELFGSATRAGSFDAKRSDLDFLVEFDPLESGKRADFYFGMKEAREELFHRRVDLVMIRAVRNRYFLEAINRDREAIYAA